MDTSNLTVTVEAARHALWRYGQTGGTQPGTFTQHLMATIESADMHNRAILRESYPELSEALHHARYDKDGIAKLQAIAIGVAA